ncbi:MAG: hypothetical protein ACXWDH_02130 [Aeromicrobium sp.]
MNETVTYAVAVGALLVAGFAALHTGRDLPFSNPLFYTVALLEIALIALLIGGCIALAQTPRDVDGVLFVSYLITVVVIPPAAVVWGIAEKSRWGTGVVVVAMLTVAVLCVRLLGIWQGQYV